MLRNIIKYLVSLAALGLLAVLYNTYYIGVIFLTVLVIPFIMFAGLSYVYGRLKVDMISVIHVAQKGEVIPVSILIDNPTVFPVSRIRVCLTYQNAYSQQKYRKKYLVSVDASTKTSVVCKLYSEYAGNLEVTLTDYKVYDYLRLFSLNRKKGTQLTIAVLPAYYELSQELFASLCNGFAEGGYYSPVISGDDPSEVFSIREYREGDRQQRIHWKLSRKQSQLMIKEFSEPLNCAVLLFVDLCIPCADNRMVYIDSILECALSLSYSLLTAGQMHYFAWYNKKQGACTRIRISKEKDLFEAVDGLLHGMPYTTETDALAAYEAEFPKDQYSNLIFITGEPSGKRTEGLSLLKAMSRQLIYVGEMDRRHGTQYDPNEEIVYNSEISDSCNTIDIRHVQRDMERLRLG